MRVRIFRSSLLLNTNLCARIWVKTWGGKGMLRVVFLWHRDIAAWSPVFPGFRILVGWNFLFSTSFPVF